MLIPSSLNSFESAPFSLLPYPANFDSDGSEVERANAFDDLAKLLEKSNVKFKQTSSANEASDLFVSSPNEQFAMQEDSAGRTKIQALYTLVRKSSSLAPTTMSRLFTTLCSSLNHFCEIISANDDPNASVNQSLNDTTAAGNSAGIVNSVFRDAYFTHLYFLFSIMSSIEAQQKLATKGGDKNKNKELDLSMMLGMETINMCAKCMGGNASKLWKFAVAEEDVISMPCRISYQILENSSRTKTFRTVALNTISTTVCAFESVTTTVVAALVDLMNSFEHVSPLIADLCADGSIPESFVVELLRDISRMDWSNPNNAKGVKAVAPFICELAATKPHTVVANFSLLLPHLDSEPYNLRSSIVQAIAHIANAAAPEENAEEDPASEVENENDNDDDNSDSPSSSPSSSSPNSKSKSKINKSNNTETYQKSVSSLLNILTERAHDVSSFTRAAVLRSWSSIVESGALPLDRVQSVTNLAIDRLQDKTVAARRAATQLLTLLLDHNPFSHSLDPTPYKAKIAEFEQWFLDNEPASEKAARAVAALEQQQFISKSDALSSVNEDEVSELDKSITEANQKELDAAIKEAEELADADEEEDEQLSEERANKTKAFDFAISAVQFIEAFEKANANLQGMLLSSNNSDVTEALRFFVCARHFQLPCAVAGMKQALTLMWSSEASIRDEVLHAFVDVFIAVPGTDGKELLPAKQIAHNLLVLAGNSTTSEQASIEEAIAQLVKTESIPSEVFLILWSVASKATGPPRAAAMLVLSMGASTDSSIVDSSSRLKHLMESGLGDHAEENKDWITARSAACALKKIGRAQSLATAGNAKHIVVTDIIEKLCSVSLGSWSEVNFDGENAMAWFCAAEQAIDALFVISTCPEKESEKIIVGLKEATFTGNSASSLALSRFFFVLGHVALKLLLYTEELSGQVRRGNASKLLALQELTDKAKKNKTKGSDEEDQDELDMAAAAEAETERQVADISEKEIVGRGLLGVFSPLLTRVVANENDQFSNELLQQTATLALTKFMCISNEFCEKHLPLLFSVLQANKSTDTTLRANVVVALGDLAFRFPNAFEPYTPRLYACLHDPSNRVKRHTLMVLTHLILNDMIKVKGQVCEIAMCIVSEESGLRDMSKLVFNELNKRSHNPIYNLLPDIIGQLSTSTQVKKEQFRTVVSFLLNFIIKEKQNEMLVEKLCHRFEACKTISQKGDLAFCLASLKINEKSIKTLNDLFKCYKDALFDEDVFRSFMGILTKAKKFASNTLQETLTEWETKLSAENADGVENFNAAKKAERAKEKASKRNVKNNAKMKSKGKSKKKKCYDSEEEEDDLVETDENTININVGGGGLEASNQPKKAAAGGRSSRSRRAKA